MMKKRPKKKKLNEKRKKKKNEQLVLVWTDTVSNTLQKIMITFNSFMLSQKIKRRRDMRIYMPSKKKEIVDVILKMLLNC